MGEFTADKSRRALQARKCLLCLRFTAEHAHIDRAISKIRRDTRVGHGGHRRDAGILNAVHHDILNLLSHLCVNSCVFNASLFHALSLGTSTIA